MLCPLTFDKSDAASVRGLCSPATAEGLFAVATQPAAQGCRQTNIPYLQELLPRKGRTLFSACAEDTVIG